MFHLSTTMVDGTRVIQFANHSKDFIEVVLAIDGKEVKEGRDVSAETRGYAYPPKLEKPVRKTKGGRPLQFDPHGGEVTAFVFEGQGSYRDEDIEKPAFLRHKLVARVRFKRTSNQHIAVLKTRYENGT